MLGQFTDADGGEAVGGVMEVHDLPVGRRRHGHGVGAAGCDQGGERGLATPHRAFEHDDDAVLRVLNGE